MQGKTVRTQANRKDVLIWVVDHDVQRQDYVRRVLSQYEVACANSIDELIQNNKEHKPDVIITTSRIEEKSSVALHTTPQVLNVPFILILEEADRDAALQADDYITLPIYPAMLIARIEMQLKMKRLQQNEISSLQHIFRQAPVAICMLSGPDFVLEQVNAAVIQILDKTESEILYKPLVEALPEIAGQGFIEMLTHVYQTGNRYVGTEQPIRLFRKGRLQDLYLSFVFEPLRNHDGVIHGVIAVGHEVTELVVAQKAALDYAEVMEAQVAYRVRELTRKNAEIREQKEFAETIINSSIVLISVLDVEMRVLAFNNKCEEAFNKRKEEVIGKKFIDVFPAIQGTVTDEGIMRALAGETVHIEIYKSPVNNHYYESFTTPLRSEKGDVYAVIVTAHDITPIVESSEKLKQSNEELIRKNDELEQFAYISSHDLQEPLRKIQTFSELVSSNISNDALAKRYLGKIEKSAASMSALIKAVLAYSSISTSESEPENADLNIVLDQVMEDLELKIEQRKAVIHHEPLPSIVGKPLQLQQLFTNLISNSIKFSEKDPVIRIHAATARRDEIIHMNLDLRRRYIKLIFQDNGIGFEQQYADRIFTIFQRLNNKTDFEGTGIGLALCKKIVEGHQGAIQAEGRPGEGSTFIIYLPA